MAESDLVASFQLRIFAQSQNRLRPPHATATAFAIEKNARPFSAVVKANRRLHRIPRLLALGVLGLSFSCLAFGQAPTQEISAWIGANFSSLSVQPIPTSATFALTNPAAEYLAITEAYPESVTLRIFHYLVSGAGLPTYERRYAAKGFGPVTYFLRVPKPAPSRVTLTNLGDAHRPPLILRLRSVTAADLERVRQADHFQLMGTIINPWQGLSEAEQIDSLTRWLPADAGRKITRGFSREIYYANRASNQVHQQLVTARQWSRQTGLPVLLGLVSWWNGTPLHVPDGCGGKFGDLRYQQVCYTLGSVHPDDPELRALLGERYNPHYCRTTPNIWSDTPWLTMNSDRLNEYRAQRLREAAAMLRELTQEDATWIAGIFLENEPRYWDTQSTRDTPQWAGERWADFNPLVVAAAQRDGVTLDPVDGLSEAELLWLQRNVGRYFQNTVDALRQGLAAVGLTNRFPIYTHSLQLDILFPGVKINQTAADWARARGARAGIEGMWTLPSDFDRVREWGPWADLNREETDGRPIGTHLWDLRVAYAAGAELYNSYNWHAITTNAYFNYARDFLAALPVVSGSPDKVEPVSPRSLRLTPPDALQAFTSVTLPLLVKSQRQPKGATLAVSVTDDAGRQWFSPRQSLSTNSVGAMEFHFPVPAEIRHLTWGTLQLHAYDLADPSAVAFAAKDASDVLLKFDMAEQRALSRLAIEWAAGAP
ncbi:MAG: hypothetical protein BWX84_01066 [Verrucomicrobia bacterium ADurb.Bin118]|nr:MAG: hypothetical protein BWX84_01066 [Verrucomicrobia bacterium ADurb.Bin118]